MIREIVSAVSDMIVAFTGYDILSSMMIFAALSVFIYAFRFFTKGEYK